MDCLGDLIGLRGQRGVVCLGRDRPGGRHRDDDAHGTDTGPHGGEPAGAALTSLRLTNSPNPSSESSRPNPEFLTPPKGSSGAVHAGWLMNTMPLSIRLATRRPRSTSPVNTEAPRPNGVALASSIASASVSTLWKDATGPKNSRTDAGFFALMPVKMVGSR